MEFNIAICDDDKTQVELISYFIEKTSTEYKINILKAFNGENLLNNIKNIDIVLLDIEMDGINGIETAKKIREKDKEVIIVFITGFKDYALNAFRIKAFDYIIKPVSEKRFKKLMNDIIRRYKEQAYFKQAEKYYIVKNGDKYTKISYKDIFCFEKVQRKILLHTSKGCYEFYGSIKSLKKELDMNCFIQSHQGFIVNKSKIFEKNKNTIYFRDIDKYVPISRRYYKNIIQALEDNLFY